MCVWVVAVGVGVEVEVVLVRLRVQVGERVTMVMGVVGTVGTARSWTIGWQLGVTTPTVAMVMMMMAVVVTAARRVGRTGFIHRSFALGGLALALRVGQTPLLACLCTSRRAQRAAPRRCRWSVQ